MAWNWKKMCWLYLFFEVVARGYRILPHKDWLTLVQVHLASDLLNKKIEEFLCIVLLEVVKEAISYQNSHSSLPKTAKIPKITKFEILGVLLTEVLFYVSNAVYSPITLSFIQIV